MLSVCEVQEKEQEPEQDCGGQGEDGENFVDFRFVPEQLQYEQVQEHARRGTEGIGDEVGDVGGTEGEGKLAEFQHEAEEEAGQDRAVGGEVEHFQIHAKGEEEDGVHEDFADVEADADVAVVIEGDEVEGSRAGKEHILKFAEREGRFEEDRPHDEEAVEEKQDVGEGESGFRGGGHGKGSLTVVGGWDLWLRKMGLFCFIFSVFRGIIGCFTIFGIDHCTDTHTDTQADGHIERKIVGGCTDCCADGNTQTHIDRHIEGGAVGIFLFFHTEFLHEQIFVDRINPILP